MKLRQTALGGICNQALAAGELPARIKFLNWGENPSDRGPFVVNETTVAALSEQIAQKSFARVLIDFEHNSLSASPNYQPPPRLHAGYGDLRIYTPHHAKQAPRGESSGASTSAADEAGVWLEDITWTPTGRRFAREYADISPAVKHDKDGVVMGVLSVALCPNGALHDVTFFSAEYNQEDRTMADEEVKKLTEQVATLEAALKKATDDLEKLTAENAELRKQLDAQGKGQTQDDGQTQDKDQDQKQDVADLQARVNELGRAYDALRKQALITSACAAGKVISLSDEAIAKLSVADLSAHIETLKPSVPLGRQTPKDAGVLAGNDMAARQLACVTALQAELKSDFGTAWVVARGRHPELFV